MSSTHNLRVSARTARLTASADGDDVGHRFGGVAVAPGDILHMDDGTPVLFTEENLRAAAETQADEPLTVDHPTDESGDPEYPPPTDQTVGRVQKAGFVEGQGLAYEATTHDEEIGKAVQAGSYDVSVHPTFTLGEQDPETGAYIAENIDFKDLSVVSKGDSPNNTAQWGPNQALAAWTNSVDIGAELENTDQPEGQEAGEKAGLRSQLSALITEFRAARDELEARQSQPETETEPEPEPEPSDEPAESGADPETDPETPTSEPETDMTDDTPEETDEQAETPDDSATSNVVEVDIGDHEDFDAFLEDKITSHVEQATAQATKAEKVDEIIAESDDFDEDDREDLMASADKIVDREHERVTTEVTASLPGAVGGRSSITASTQQHSETTDDIDAYGTGVKED